MHVTSTSFLSCLLGELALPVVLGHLAEYDEEAEYVDGHHGEEVCQGCLIPSLSLAPGPVPTVEQRRVPQHPCRIGWVG